MAYFSGSDGRLFFDDNGNWRKAARATNWMLTTTQTSLDTTTLECTDRTVTPGVRSTTGSCSIFYYQPSEGDNGLSTARNDNSNWCAEIVGKLISEQTDTSVDSPGVAKGKPQMVRFRFSNHDGSNGTASEANRGKWIEVDAYLTSATMTMAVGEIFRAEIAFDVVGAPRDVTMFPVAVS